VTFLTDEGVVNFETLTYSIGKGESAAIVVAIENRCFGSARVGVLGVAGDVSRAFLGMGVRRRRDAEPRDLLGVPDR
jgi:hypothetical protein